MKYEALKNMATFGVAGNFTGHLEQAGEARDFVNVVTKEANAPKAVFPTYIPNTDSEIVPDYLKVFPFDCENINYPAGADKLQIEPECALIYDVTWEGEKVSALKAKCFGASNDCSIRREGAKKISEKKNWGNGSKGFSGNAIMMDSFTANGNIENYRIASFLVRDNVAHDYGEDSAVRDYSYVYEKLDEWIIDKLNNQECAGPAEHIGSYLLAAGKPESILVSIGATRYTDFGEHNFLIEGDRAVVVVYPEKYTHEDIMKMVVEKDYSRTDISFLDQTVKYE